MANKVIDIMNARDAYLISTIKSLEKKIDSYPEGKINIRPNKSGYSYFWHRGNTYRYLNKSDTELIKQLIQKDLIADAISKAKTEEFILHELMSKYPTVAIEDLYGLLPEKRKKYASPIFLNNVEYAKHWLSLPFAPKSFGKDGPEYYTIKGERVRSKSEVIIADRLFSKGIPYKYECPLKVGKEIIHPDFTILRHSDRKIVFHEHCGMMGDKQYGEDMVDRVNKYGKAGIFVGDRLFFTFESSDHPFDISWLDDFIERNYR